MTTPDTVPPHPGGIIRQHLVTLAMTQKDLAHRVGVNDKHMSAVITGKCPVTPRLAVRIEQAFGLVGESLLAESLLIDQARHDAAQHRAQVTMASTADDLIALIEALPDMLKAARADRGLSLRDAQGITGVSINTWSRFERRAASIYVDALPALLRFVADEPSPATADGA